MTPSGRIRAGLLLLLGVLVAGTTSYVLLEHVSVLDAVYMVVITVSTVGFSEVFPLGPAGRVITVGVIVLGVGAALYTATGGIERMLLLGSTRRRKRLMNQIAALSGHVILCGFGRVGRGTYENLLRRGVDVVVVENDAARVEEARDLGAIAIEGDATHNDTLREAGLGRAGALVACVRNDSDNLVIVLSAKALRPDVHVVSRATELESEEKLLLAGADRVVAPQVVGSERLAAMAVEPSLAEVVDVLVGGRTVEFVVEEAQVDAASPVAGRTIREAAVRERSGATVLAVESVDRSRLVTPTPDLELRPGMVVVVVGTGDQVAAALELLGP